MIKQTYNSTTQSMYDDAKDRAENWAALFDYIHDKLLEALLDKRMAEWEPIIRKSLSQKKDGGVLMFVEFYRTSEDKKGLTGIFYLAHGLNPNAAFQTYKKTGGISTPRPQGTLSDKKSSFMIWCTQVISRKKAGSCSIHDTNNIVYKKIEWPQTEWVVNSKYPSK